MRLAFCTFLILIASLILAVILPHALNLMEVGREIGSLPPTLAI